MGDWLKLASVAAFCYLLGSLNGSITLSRFFLKDDIRRHGSGNAGATNVLRTYGKRWTVLVSLWDMGKAAPALLLAMKVSESGWRGGWYTRGFSSQMHNRFADWIFAVAGLCVILGHVFPLFFGFKGGKGVFTTCMVMLLLTPWAACAALGVFILVVGCTRYVSAGSITAVTVLPFAVWLFKYPPPAIALAALIALLVTLLHRDNVKRLMEGTEHKFSLKSTDN